MDIFNPSNKDTDILIKYILKPLFGYGENKELFFAEPMTVFLSGCLVLVAILFIYNLLTDTANTANSGKMLAGRGQNLTWSVLRNVIGIALLIPIKGIAVAQMIFVWIAAQGLMLANSVYEKMNWLELDNENLAYVSNIQGDLYKSYKVATLAHVCLEAAKSTGVTNSFSGKPLDFNLSITKGSQAGDYKNYNYNFGTKLDPKLCGQLTVGFPKIKENNLVNSSDSLSDITKFSLINAQEVSSKIQGIHISAMDDLIQNKAKQTALIILKNEQGEKLNNEVLNKTIKDLANYEEKIKAVFNEVSKIDTKAKKEMTKQGIAAAGSWIWALSNTQTTLTNILNDTPKVTSSFNNEANEAKSCAGWFSSFQAECITTKKLNDISPTIKSNIDKTLFTLSSIDKEISNNFNKSNPALAKAAKAEAKEDGVIDKILSAFDGLDITKKFTTDRTSETNPLVAQQAVGAWILGIAQSIFAVLVTGAAIPVLGDSFIGATLAFLPFVLSVIVAAMVIVFYLPMLPFIIWIGNLIGWIVMLFQAMLGIPIWLVSFMRNDSDGFVGKTGQGYLLILEGFLRPSLMIFALYFAFYLLVPVTKIVNFFFLFVTNSIYSNISSFFAVCYYIFTIVIYAVLLNKIMVILFNLIESIPDKILTWIGSNVNSIMSNSGKELDNQVSAGTNRINNQVSAGMGIAAGQAVNYASNRKLKPEEEKKGLGLGINNESNSEIDNKLDKMFNDNANNTNPNTNANNANEENKNFGMKNKNNSDIDKVFNSNNNNINTNPSTNANNANNEEKTNLNAFNNVKENNNIRDKFYSSSSSLKEEVQEAQQQSRKDNNEVNFKNSFRNDLFNEKRSDEIDLKKK
ncbi:TPA: DotA/TraY family protein [Haemophilus influenzae]